MLFSLQPELKTALAILTPLETHDFNKIYEVASDPAIWVQHPNPDRWKRDVFQHFFEGAMQSGGAFKILNPDTGECMGSTRFYDYNESEDSILIGYTFYATQYWGKGINLTVKKAMLDYIFQFVSTVYFHVGAGNIRSRIAMERLGAVCLGEMNVAYYGEAPKLNVVYCIKKQEWQKQEVSANMPG
jgi:RimJ/RimL family protein N-acetyltransferase